MADSVVPLVWAGKTIRRLCEMISVRRARGDTPRHGGDPSKGPKEASTPNSELIFETSDLKLVGTAQFRAEKMGNWPSNGSKQFEEVGRPAVRPGQDVLCLFSLNFASWKLILDSTEPPLRVLFRELKVVSIRWIFIEWRRLIFWTGFGSLTLKSWVIDGAASIQPIKEPSYSVIKWTIAVIMSYWLAPFDHYWVCDSHPPVDRRQSRTVSFAYEMVFGGVALVTAALISAKEDDPRHHWEKNLPLYLTATAARVAFHSWVTHQRPFTYGSKLGRWS